MFPDAKLHLVNTLKAMGEVVAMTGDGVNDGPSLKAAHIGIAMGKKGTEVARQAASLVLVKDDLSKMLKAIALGRKIYMNLKKAISYIVSIHIPIILSVTIPLVFGWEISGIFDPIHVIFLELVMGPTCSIAFESEPEEPGIMEQKPRSQTDSFFSTKELLWNISQGIVLSMFVLAVYYVAMSSSVSKDQIRTLVFTSLVFGNVFLTLANRSVYRSVLRTIFTPNLTLWLMLGITCLILFSALYIPVVQGIFRFAHIPGSQILYCLAGVLPAVFWIEIPKWWIRRKTSAKGVSF
jgi:Ca2+-transporting ATPase